MLHKQALVHLEAKEEDARQLLVLHILAKVELVPEYNVDIRPILQHSLWQSMHHYRKFINL